MSKSKGENISNMTIEEMIESRKRIGLIELDEIDIVKGDMGSEKKSRGPGSPLNSAEPVESLRKKTHSHYALRNSTGDER